MPTFRLKPLFLLCALSMNAFAQEAPQLQLQQNLLPYQEDSEDLPIFLSADLLEGHQGEEVEAFGNVELRKRGQSIAADWMKYVEKSDELQAKGHVEVNQNGSLMTGPELRLQIKSNIGFMTKPDYFIAENHSRGHASLLNFAGKNKYNMKQAIYTTCPAGNDDWYMQIRDLDIDRSEQVGIAHGAVVRFKNVPFLYAPYLDFPISNRRRSGFLAPLFGSTVNGGAEFTLPYYWNIAPNFDATIAPRLLSKRGLMLNDEFRYLEPGFQGEAHYNVLPGDSITKTTRSELILKHREDFGGGLTGALNVQKVSDNNFYRDLATTVGSTSQINLSRDASLNYGGDGWSLNGLIQRFQTLQDPLAPVGVPYYRTPQVQLRAWQNDFGGANLAFTGEFTDFSHPTAVNGQRLVLNPSASLPLANSFGYLTPKIALHSASYSLGANNVGRIPNATVNVPIFSLDSGVFFERDTSFAGRGLTQTLEPRLYYVYIPYRNQNYLPNFDSAPIDFGFAQIFNENQFAGNDRVADANQVTLALSSRFIEQNSGTERLRLSLGQRYYLQQQQILPAFVQAIQAATGSTQTVPGNSSRSDLLAGLSGALTDKMRLSADMQYDPSRQQSKKINFNAHYEPEIGKLINLGYRFSRNILEQFDLSGQWPIYGRWHGVARWNYSLFDKKLLDGIVGIEYDQSCWAFRIVSKRFATATQQMASAIFIQLELTGLAKVGSDPLETLRKSIQGYANPNTAQTAY